MFEDKDIKIVGEKPSETVKIHAAQKSAKNYVPSNKSEEGKLLGQTVAAEFIKAGNNTFSETDGDDSHMMMQRLLLLSFVVTVGFETFCGDDSVAGIAQKSFLDTVKRDAPELYSYSSDTGAFSFYYLAYRRGGDIERRIGQTFAMLCSHDGDPIYQELGETLYCWFSSLVEKKVRELGF